MPWHAKACQGIPRHAKVCMPWQSMPWHAMDATEERKGGRKEGRADRRKGGRTEGRKTVRKTGRKTGTKPGRKTGRADRKPEGRTGPEVWVNRLYLPSLGCLIEQFLIKTFPKNQPKIK